MAPRRARAVASTAEVPLQELPVTSAAIPAPIAGAVSTTECEVPLKAKAKGRKVGLSERPANAVTAAEDELAQLTAKLQEVTLEKERQDIMLKEQDAKLKQSEGDKAKLKRELQKLQKKKAFEPELDMEVLRVLANKDAVSAEDADQEKKEKKDPRKPKHPGSAYLIWQSENYQEVKKERPNATFSEMNKIMSERWKEAPTEVKKHFETKFSQQQQMFKEAMITYERVLAEEQKQDDARKKMQEMRAQEEAMKLLELYAAFSKEVEDISSGNDGAASKKRMKDPEKPKQPTSAFIFFCQERRRQIPAGEKRNVAEEGKALGDEWKKLKAMQNGTKKFEEMAATDRERYAREMDSYKSRKQQEETELKAMKEKKDSEDMKKALSAMEADASRAAPKTGNVAAEPKSKKGPTGYQLFCTSARASIRTKEPNITFGDLQKRLGHAWSELSPEEKAKWTKKSMEAANQAAAPKGLDASDFAL